MKVTKKPGWRPGMTLKTHPNYYHCESEQVRWITKSEWVVKRQGRFIDVMLAFLNSLVGEKEAPRFEKATNTPYRK